MSNSFTMPIPPLTAIIYASATIAVAFITSYTTTNGRIAALDNNITQVKTTEDNHYNEVQRQLTEFRRETNDKLDLILKIKGI